jgi:hypothetical protein
MKTRLKKSKSTGSRTVAAKRSRSVKRPQLSKRLQLTKRPARELTLLEKIAKATEELQGLRSRLANAGDDLPAVGMNRITYLESELEKLWEMRRHEQAAPLRQTALSEEEEKILAFPSAGRAH